MSRKGFLQNLYINDFNYATKHEAIQVYREAVAQRCFVKKVFLQISENSQENTCARASFLIKLQALGDSVLRVAGLKGAFL